ncbi:V-type ATP synthase subunit C [Peptoniphilus sp. oral taxon 386]|uniref:V-type ATP synthase subunit C n=1 Tax=Peptoniphilus sp. oral taxon 386 TaxID=652713 RepID=UPI0001DAA057|nr:V-type ATP synthase subunit C [Peptoniphilus sp. oral taxon 386]EFI41634.1 ATP synthase, subunit C [Peptoniphilus sp. oral taxon 386 str. F0131]
MDRNLFIQQSAIVRVLEKKLLNKSVFDRMSESRNLEDALRILGDSVYQSYILKLNRNEDFEEALKSEQEDVYKKAYDLSPDDRIVDILVLKYHYHNIKVFIKENILGEDFRQLYIEYGNFDVEKIKKQFLNEKNSSGEFYEVIKLSKEEYEKTKDPQCIDIIVDEFYFSRLKELVKDIDSDLFYKYIEDLIDFTNINTLLRCQKQERTLGFLNRVLIDGGSIKKNEFFRYLNNKIDEDSMLFKPTRIYRYVKHGIEEYNQTNSLLTFEKEKDNYFINLIKDVKRITYGPEVLFAYLLAKEMEIKNLRIIMISKMNGLDASFIKERLRDSYV